MFDIGWSELLVIGVVALIAIGPKELPGVLRSAGQWIGKIKRMAAEFQGQFQEALREADMADLKKHADDLNNMSKSLTSGLDPYDAMRDMAGETKPAVTAATEAVASEATPDAGLDPAAPATTPAVTATPEAAPAPGVHVEGVHVKAEDVKADDAPSGDKPAVKSDV